jgi:hypothetical protein
MSKENPWTEHPIDVVALYCPADSQALAQLRADARALWAVRVLDAWAARNPSKLAPATAPIAKRENVLGWTTFVLGIEYDGASPDAARLAAAEAVFPELPESVRADLGAKP